MRQPPPRTGEAHGATQARLTYGAIRRLLAALAAAEAADDESALEAAGQAIYEEPLSIEVRSAWHEVGVVAAPPGEFCVLLCTGGPAVRLIGKLGRWAEPETARLEWQDWGTPWTPWRQTAAIEDTLLAFARRLSFSCE